jgi:ketosteroid isomerase-like protein
VPRRFAAAVAALSLALALTLVARADEAATVRAAVDELYGALATGNADALTALLPHAGFTEFSPPERVLKVLDVAYFRRVLASGVRIDLHVAQPQIHVQDDSAIVTGYRIGSVTLADGKRVDFHDCMTMAWTRDRATWKLRHVHISDCS